MRIEYRGSGFMYHMVRILTGTLLEVGDGRRTPESVKAALAGRDRADAGFLAPARGLTLKRSVLLDWGAGTKSRRSLFGVFSKEKQEDL